MAPTRTKSGSSSAGSKRGGSARGGSTRGRSRSSGNSRGPSKPSHSITKTKPNPSQNRPAKQQKTKPALGPPKRKKRTYTEKELGIQKLNMITPAGVQKPNGKKKGKVFVDDQESMMTILAMVNADKEGQIESKMMKARQMEEIRQARQKEMEARSEEKKSKLEATKDSLRRPRNQRKDDNDPKGGSASEGQNTFLKLSKAKKRVSFGGPAPTTTFLRLSATGMT